MLLMILLTSMMRRTLEMTMVHLNILHRVTQKACSSSIFKIIFTSTPENISQKKQGKLQSLTAHSSRAGRKTSLE